MTIKSRLNSIAILSVGAVLVLFAFLIYNNLQMTNQRDQIERVEQFTKTVIELNILTEQYLAYGEQRYLESWNQQFKELKETRSTLRDFPKRNVISNSLPSIQNAFELILEIRNNPESYANISERERLLERAKSRIRSDIQMLIAASHNLAKNRRDTIRQIQATQRNQFLFLMIPAVILIVYVALMLRKRIIHSLNTLLQGTKNIARGDLNKLIDIEGDDEHTQLAEGFNTMTKKLREVIKREKNLRQEAEDNQKRWEKLVEQIPNLIIISIDGEIKFINSAGLDIIGAEKADQILGMTAHDLLGNTYRNKIIKRIDQVQNNRKKGPPGIYRINTLNDEERYLRLESRAIKYGGQDAMQTVGLDITKHVQYEMELQNSLEEKTVLLKEIHHRVKNNLAVISGLMQLQAMESDNEMLKAQLNDSMLRIHSMALIHELLYDSDNFSKLKIKNHIKKMVKAVLKTVTYNSPIEVEYEIEDILLNINQAIPCALILNELVTNSVKHAFNESVGGKIHIKLNEIAGKIRLSVSDDGVGLPKDFSIENNSSFGMLISKTLAKQLGSSIEYHTDNGSQFFIQFEKSDSKGSRSHYVQ